MVVFSLNQWYIGCIKLLHFKVKEIADKLYGTKIAMKMEKQEVVFDTVVTTFDLKFENKVYIAAQAAAAKLRESSMPIRAAILFEMFPFCILFTVSSLFVNIFDIPFNITNIFIGIHIIGITIIFCFLINFYSEYSKTLQFHA